MSTKAAVVNPPAASATPQATSNAIQIPQGLWLSRLVTEPRPKSMRVSPKENPTPMRIKRVRVPKVKKGFVIRCG
ncbi:MAG: hypothetical protein H6Q85_2389 [candidate division NC10 bacterium]|nr:hypothetical protein [candidate division NC10 bacterium]